MIKSMLQNGHEVIACAPNDDGNVEAKIKDLGAKYVAINMKRTGMNPLKDLTLIGDIIKILKREKPDAFYHILLNPTYMVL
ncbi:hypothetical protein [Thalassobacillus sp. C254]|uniref:hypothetical protein n=1 Tax=Thalassobacillus sp. C254 TaxID=1225341 RepID=UPI0006D1854E|nr:hypothetical protein [Thalassobacillus sp. C254]